tara:strand:- start:10637 stop:11323 length:687 start_codon:yes stop_codon:yes gene_type:complete
VPTGDAELRLERLSGDVVTSKWYDTSASGNNGIASVASILADFYFDGIGNNPPVHFVDAALPTSASNPASNWTLEMWVTHDAADPPPAGREAMVSTRDGGLSTGWTLRNQALAIGDPIDLDTFGGVASLAAAIIPANRDAQWYHYAVTWEPGSPATLNSYVNGALHATVSAPATHQWATAVGTNLGLRVGAGTYNEWAGYIDTVRVYPRILSPDEILRDYHAGKPAHP